MVDRCVCCGEVVPEGRMVCLVCEKQAFGEQKSETSERNKKSEADKPKHLRNIFAWLCKR